MKFLRSRLLILLFTISYAPHTYAQDEEAFAQSDEAQELTVDDPAAESFTDADIVAAQPSSDDDFAALMKEWEEPAPATVITTPEPPPSAEAEPLTIDLPVIGTINLYPYKDEITGKAGFRVKMPPSGRLLSLGPLVLNDGAFTFIDGKLSYGAAATLFGEGVRVVLREVSQGETQKKEITRPGKPTKTVDARTYTKVRLGVDFLPGRKPTFEIIPGARFTVVSADVVLAKKQPIQFIVGTTIAGKHVDFTFIPRKKSTDAIASIPPMPLKKLIPDVAGTPVEDVEIEDMSLTIKNFISKDKPPKKRVIKLHGKLDFSHVAGLEESEEAKAMELTGTYDAKKGTYVLEATTKDITLPNVGVIHHAKIAINLTRKTKKAPLKKSVILQGDMEFDAGFGKFTLAVASEITKKGIEFSGEIQQEVSFNGVTIKNPKVTYSSKTKSFSISGQADILGYETTLTLGKDKKGNMVAQASLGDKPLKPFEKLHIPVFEDIAIKNAQLGFEQKKGAKNLTIKGTITLFGKETGIILYMSGAGIGEPKLLAIVDIPGSMEITDITDHFGPIGDVFKAVSTMVSIKLNKAKFIISNQTAKDIPDVGSVSPGIGITGNAEVGGVVGSALSVIGLRGGVDADIFMPLNLSDVENMHVSIGKTVNQSLAGDLVKIDKLAFFLQGARPPKFPPMGIDLSAEIAGAQLDLKGSFQPTGAIDIEGTLKGDINLNKIGFPLQIKNPLIELHMLGGEPTGLGIAGIFQFGNARGDIYADIDVKDPLNSIIQFSKLNICITDTYNFWLTMAQKGAQTGTSFNLPNIMCLEDVSGQWAMKIPYATKKNCEKDCNVKPGLALHGKVNLGIPAIPKGKLDLEISPSKIEAQGSLDGKIDLAGIIKISDTSGKNPPSLGILITKEDQKTWIDGLVDLTVIKQQTKMYLSSSGVQLNGKMEISIPSVGSGVADIIIDTSKPEAKGIGRLDKKIDFGGIIKITDASGDNPPSIGISVSKSEQKIWIDGLVNFAGIFKDQTKIYLTSSGLQFDLLTSYLGVETTVGGKFPFKHPEDGEVEYKLSLEKLNNFVKDDLKHQFDIAKDQVSKYMGKATDAINDAEGKCGNLEVLSDLCKAPLEIAKGTIVLLKETVNASMLGIDTIAREVTKQFHFNSVSIKGSLASFKGEGSLVSLTFGFVIFGKNVGPITLSIPSPKDVGSLVKTLAEYIYDHHLKSIVNELVGQAEKIYHDTVGFLDKAVGAVMGAFNDIAGAAQEVAKVATKFANDVKDTTIKVGNTFKNVGEQAGGAIKDFTLDAANKISTTAVDVGNKIAGVATDVGNQAANVAKETGEFTQEAANKIKGAFETAGNKMRDAFETAGHYMNPANWF